MDTPPTMVAISSHEQHYACGCTTTRIEQILLLDPDDRRCAGHGGALTRIVHTTEFQSESAHQAWQLRPTD